MRMLMGAAAAALLLASGPGSVEAHHSMAMFDQNSEITVTGTVRQFQWSNPHAYIQLVATSDQGEPVEWSLELGSPVYLYARGWRPRTLRPGQEVRVRINPLRNGRPGGAVLDVTDMDGNAIGSNRR
ncbi:DUF6152 family protein [Aurantiacibacter sp. MUD11]|uniref:DUF6152 family protein n=1 Tax=Aurantiacibacter sp. MUD11 TaxID=3003265 RepID=UPI0022AB3319|nr:DUF6152 family protein [Aurantiacibacter sp. MUD11]WAT18821.1 DUF6152 family protein [Aurantiacibacter sp. MUD11]